MNNNSSTYSQYFPKGLGAPIELSFLNAIDLRYAETVQNGQLYYITDATHSGITTCDLGIVVTGIPDGKNYSLQGWGGFLNADYQGVGDYSGVESYTTQTFFSQFGIWKDINEGANVNNDNGYTNGDIVIWNGLHYQVMNSAAFDGTFPKDGVNGYALLPKSAPNVGYIEEWDEVEYDILNDWMQRRKDKRGNDVICDYQTFQDFMGGTLVPFNDFQWGYNGCYGNIVENSYYKNANSKAYNTLGSSFTNGIKVYASLEDNFQLIRCRLMGGFDRPIDFVGDAVDYIGKVLSPEKSTFNSDFLEFATSGTMTVPYYIGEVIVAFDSPGDATCNSFDTAPPFPRRFRVSVGADASVVFDNSNNIRFPNPTTSTTIPTDELSFITFKYDENLSMYKQIASEQYS